MRLRKSSLEKKAIKWALCQPKPWDVDATKSSHRLDPKTKCITGFKARLKAFHLAQQNKRCCYCQVPLEARNIETDREHIIPKDRFKYLSFEVFNTSVSCKTCNMSVKGIRTGHLRNFRRTSTIYSKDILDERNYNIVHPNIHYWHEHIELFAEESGPAAIRIYYPITRRGRFTYNYFKLANLEISNNTQAQKQRPRKRVAQRAIDPQVMEIAARHGQAR